MEEDHAEDHEGQQVMQAEKLAQGGIVHAEAAPEQRDDPVADDGEGAEQVGDDGRAPEGHLAPGQHVAHESGGHHQQEDDDTDHPQQLARRLAGVVVHAAPDVDALAPDHLAVGSDVDADLPALLSPARQLVHHLAVLPSDLRCLGDRGIEGLVRRNQGGRGHPGEFDPLLLPLVVAALALGERTARSQGKCTCRDGQPASNGHVGLLLWPPSPPFAGGESGGGACP